MESFHEKIKLDKRDRHLLEKHSWSFDGVYPQAMINSKKTRLHNVLMPKKDGYFVDHINRDPLDNRRSNLRYVSPQENTWNQSISSRNTTGSKNVYWCKQKSKWIVKITNNFKELYFGSFSKKENAIEVAKDKIFELRGCLPICS